MGKLAAAVKSKLKTARSKAGFSQQEVADRMEVSRSRVSAHENVNGAMQPDVEDLERYATLYNVSALHFLDDKSGSSLLPDELVSLYHTLSPQNQQVVLSLTRALSVPDPKVIADFIRGNEGSGISK